MRLDFAARLWAVLSACDRVKLREGSGGRGKRTTSETTSRSFCVGWCFVAPEGLRMFFVSEVCSRANLGLLWRIESSIGGSILVALGWFEVRRGCVFVLTRLSRAKMYEYGPQRGQLLEYLPT